MLESVGKYHTVRSICASKGRGHDCFVFLSSSFVAVLQEKGFKPTTQRCYLMDVVAFMKYISNMAPPSVRLGTKKINAILLELRARIRDIRKDVVGHQLSVRRSKSGMFIIHNPTSIH